MENVQQSRLVAWVRWSRAWFLRGCAAGLGLGIALLVIPESLKPYQVRQTCSDYKSQIDLVTVERGLGPYGLVVGHRAKVYADDARQLDFVRADWSASRTRPAPLPAIDSRMLMWNTFGPSCTTTTGGIGVVEVGSYFCLPYSCLIIGCAVPLLWAGLCSWLRRAKPDIDRPAVAAS